MTPAAGHVAPLLAVGLLVGLRITVAGLAWGWALPVPPSAGSSRAVRRLGALAAVSVCGIAVNALLAAFLGEFGRFTPVWDLSALAAVCIAGVLLQTMPFWVALLARSRERERAEPGRAPLRVKTGGLAAWWRDALVGAAILPLACAALMALPGRGEWLAGGWDPGVYVNQGLALERTGRHDPGVLRAYSRMDAAGFEFFTRGTDGYRECFPAVPIDPTTREARAYFFRLMPSWIAVLARCGGAGPAGSASVGRPSPRASPSRLGAPDRECAQATAAVRVNLVTGMAAVLSLMGLVLASGGGVPLAVFTVLLFGVQPLFLYHLSVPTSELLQGVLVFGLFACIGNSRAAAAQRGRTAPSPSGAGVGALLMLAAVLNRVSFVPFGALFLAVAAWVERFDEDRRGVARRHAAWAVALAAGATWTWAASRPALLRLAHELPAMTVVTAACLVAAGCIHWAAATGAGRDGLRRLPAGWPRAAWAVAVLALVAIARGGQGRVMANLSGNLTAALPFVGKTLVACAMAGAGWLAWRAGRTGAQGGADRPAGDSEPRLASSLGGYAAFAAGVTALLLVNQSIAQVYPWATRRYLEFTVPMLCVLAAAIPAALWRAGHGRRALPLLALAALALAAPAAGGARRAVHAWRCTAYDGLIAALDAASGQLEPGATVVVDDPRWGTPLLLGWGIDAVNGKPLCASDDASAAAPGVTALDALREEGRPVAFLTSTDSGMAIFRAAFTNAVLSAELPPVTLAETIHSRRATDFATRPRRVEFRLYMWEP